MIASEQSGDSNYKELKFLPSKAELTKKPTAYHEKDDLSECEPVPFHLATSDPSNISPSSTQEEVSMSNEATQQITTYQIAERLLSPVNDIDRICLTLENRSLYQDFGQQAVTQSSQILDQSQTRTIDYDPSDNHSYFSTDAKVNLAQEDEPMDRDDNTDTQNHIHGQSRCRCIPIDPSVRHCYHFTGVKVTSGTGDESRNHINNEDTTESSHIMLQSDSGEVATIEPSIRHCYHYTGMHTTSAQDMTKISNIHSNKDSRIKGKGHPQSAGVTFDGTKKNSAAQEDESIHHNKKDTNGTQHFEDIDPSFRRCYYYTGGMSRKLRKQERLRKALVQKLIACIRRSQESRKNIILSLSSKAKTNERNFGYSHQAQVSRRQILTMLTSSYDVD